jgi:Flp pilus assembly pilin Flp
MKNKLMLSAIRAQNAVRSVRGNLEKGQNTTEYGIFIAGVIVVVLLVIGIFTGALQRLWEKVADLIAGS